MAIARVMAVKKFRWQLISLKHPHVGSWTNRKLKNAIFRNGEDWIELLRWLMGELDVEIQECLRHCTTEERVTRIKESLMVLGLSCPETVNATVEGRVIFKDRDELVSQLIELVKMKKAIDSGMTPCFVDTNGLLFTEDLENVKSGDSDNAASGKSSDEKTEAMSGKELFFLLLEKHPEYQRLMLLATGEDVTAQEDKEAGESGENEQGTSSAGGKKSTKKADLPENRNPQDPGPSGCDPRKPKTTKCSCGKEIGVASTVQMSDLKKKKLAMAEVKSEAKEGGCARDSPIPNVSIDDGKTVQGAAESKLLKVKTGADGKPLNYLEAVHDMVDTLERTFRVTD
ncbi:uncharacterized protein LOC124171352 isoform X1 [Ischnura elegans]|uniref:uncharacterized protein LOC124171352 isoform X1 n=1 Tax=Ischnura elegans TaxID=197161 RepID=UPI001ED8BC1A|nr:uncharacterized protein LOC124171352 isoform X1 [Ischnura elegans]